jgi:muramoyltetrapeptide carboxypeptidase
VINRIVLAQATPFAPPLAWFDGAVLFWEEIGGQASYIWSYLQVMRHCGILDRISGMVVGVPRDIAGLETPAAREKKPGASPPAREKKPGASPPAREKKPGASPTLAEIVLEVLGDRDIPVLGDVDFGHAGPNLPMPVGLRVGLDAQRRTLSLLEPAVRPHGATEPAG